MVIHDLSDLLLSLLLNRIRTCSHGSQITSNGLGALVITGKSLVITGDGNHWRYSAP
jgi:hypothetical protein